MSLQGFGGVVICNNPKKTVYIPSPWRQAGDIQRLEGFPMRSYENMLYESPRVIKSTSSFRDGFVLRNRPRKLISFR